MSLNHIAYFEFDIIINSNGQNNITISVLPPPPLLMRIRIHCAMHAVALEIIRRAPITCNAP